MPILGLAKERFNPHCALPYALPPARAGLARRPGVAPLARPTGGTRSQASDASGAPLADFRGYMTVPQSNRPGKPRTGGIFEGRYHEIEATPSGDGRVVEFRALTGDGLGPFAILDVVFREP